MSLVDQIPGALVSTGTIPETPTIGESTRHSVGSQAYRAARGMRFYQRPMSSIQRCQPLCGEKSEMKF